MTKSESMKNYFGSTLKCCLILYIILGGWGVIMTASLGEVGLREELLFFKRVSLRRRQSLHKERIRYLPLIAAVTVINPVS